MLKFSRLFVAKLLLFTSLTSLTSFAETSQSPTAPTIADEKAEENSYLQRHLPFYFAYGNPLTKIQVSFKTPLVRKFPLYFAYSQLMFWALREESVPFRDLTYNPEFFYRVRIHNAGMMRSIDAGIWDHNSNGKAGGDSRSYNANYVRFNFEKEGQRWTTRLTTQLTYKHGYDLTNKDIDNYVGPLSLNLTFVQLFDSWIDKSEISIQAIPGGKFAQRWDYGGYQLSFSFRVGANLIVPAFYLQYYRGFAETLLNYNQRVDAFRVGMIF